MSKSLMQHVLTSHPSRGSNLFAPRHGIRCVEEATLVTCMYGPHHRRDFRGVSPPAKPSRITRYLLRPVLSPSCICGENGDCDLCAAVRVSEHRGGGCSSPLRYPRPTHSKDTSLPACVAEFRRRSVLCHPSLSTSAESVGRRSFATDIVAQIVG